MSPTEKQIEAAVEALFSFGLTFQSSPDRYRAAALAALTAAEAQEVKPAGMSPWQGWDQGRDDWARTKHQDRVCNAVFGPAWSMEDAHELISFIDRTWGGSA